MVRGEITADTAIQKLSANMLAWYPDKVTPCTVSLYYQEGEGKKKAIFQTSVNIKPLQNTLVFEVILADGRKVQKSVLFPASYNNGDYSDNFDEIIHLNRHKDAVRSLGFTSDSRYLVSGGDDGMILVMKANTLEMVQKIKAHTGYVRKAVTTHDGKHIVSCGEDKTVKLWDLATGKLLHTFSDHTTQVYSLAVSQDGKYIAAGGQYLYLWEFASHKQVMKASALKFANFLTLTFSADSQYLFGGDEDRWLHIWDVAKKETKYQRKNIHPGAVSGIAVHPSLLYFYSGDRNGNGKWWQLLLNPKDSKWEDEDYYAWEMRLNLVKGRFEDPAMIELDYVKTNIKEFPKIQGYPLYYLTKDYDELPEKDWLDKIERPLTEFKSGVVQMSMSGNGEYLMVATGEGTIRMVETFTGLKRWDVELHRATESGAFSYDGAFAALGGMDGEIRVFGKK